jgi:hypothetical protein
MYALQTQKQRFRGTAVGTLLSLALVGCLCLLAASMASCSIAPTTSTSTQVRSVAPSPTPNQDVFVHLNVEGQTGHLSAGAITLYVTLTLTNGRSAQIGLLSSCFNFSLLDQHGDFLWGSGNPCILSNYNFAELQPGHTYTIEKDTPLIITVSIGLEAGTYVLGVGYFRWHEGPNVPGTPIAGAQGDASGQTSVELS